MIKQKDNTMALLKPKKDKAVKAPAKKKKAAAKPKAKSTAIPVNALGSVVCKNDGSVVVITSEGRKDFTSASKISIVIEE